MSTVQLHQLFNSNFYQIPKYQRGYSWEVNNVRELFDDIKEAIEADSHHYIGTIVLTRGASKQEFFIVDGQQRLTTLTLIINELINHLPADDFAYNRRFFIVENGRYRIVPQNRDKEYFEIILGEDDKREPKNKSQRRLREVAAEVSTLVEGIENKQIFFDRIKNLEVMKFVEDSQANGIRIFQTMNDRGKLLTSLEKVKSLLVYYSNRYLASELDSYINEAFSDILEYYDDIKQIGDDLDVTLIKAKDFNEDNLLRYHFVTFSLEDLDPSAEVVLECLKSALIAARNRPQGESRDSIDGLIKKYVSGLREFFQICYKILDRAKHDPRYFKLFAILNLSARLYPLIIRLESRALLDETSGEGQQTYFDLVERLDVRVYKTRGTDPKAEITRFVYGSHEKSKEEIADWLKNFNRNWMPTDLFKNLMKSKVYGNRAAIFILINYCEYVEQTQFSIDKLISLMKKKPTQEHILSQLPNFDLTALGFNDIEEYSQHEGMFGNLTILEQSYNSALRNKAPLQKVETYGQSDYIITKKTATEIAMKRGFTKQDILDRSEVLAEFIIHKWGC